MCVLAIHAKVAPRIHNVLVFLLEVYAILQLEYVHSVIPIVIARPQMDKFAKDISAWTVYTSANFH